MTKRCDPASSTARRAVDDARKQVAIGDLLQAIAFLQTARNGIIAGRDRDEIAGMIDEGMHHVKRARENS